MNATQSNENLGDSIETTGRMAGRIRRRIKRIGARLTGRRVERQGSHRMMRIGLGVAGAVAVAVLSATVTVGAPATTAHAAAGSLHYQQGLYLDDGWLCRGWSNGSYHCTAHWHWSNGRLISDNPSWVPNNGGSWTAPSHPASQPNGYSGPISYGGGGSTAGYPFGSCTWGAARLSWDNVTYLGNAKDWFWNARARGMATGYTPRVGATVVYQPGVQGASGLGHVAHVVAVYGNGTFEVEEMSYYGYGGGWGIFSYRTSWVQPGVSFIY